MRLIDADKLYPDSIGRKGLAISQSQIANAPTADDWQKYSDELWKNAYEKCKEDVIHRIAKQYIEHNEVVPIWLSIGDMRGDRE